MLCSSPLPQGKKSVLLGGYERLRLICEGLSLCSDESLWDIFTGGFATVGFEPLCLRAQIGTDIGRHQAQHGEVGRYCIVSAQIQVAFDGGGSTRTDGIRPAMELLLVQAQLKISTGSRLSIASMAHRSHTLWSVSTVFTR